MKLIKRIFAAALSLQLIGAPVFADTTTTRYSMTKPDVGSASWGPKLNANADIIDNAGGLALANVWTNTQTFNGNTTFSAGTTVTISTAATFTGWVAVGTANKKKPLTVEETVSTFTTVGANPVVWIGGGNSSVNSLSEIGFTYGFTGAYTETFAPATIGYQLTSGSGLTKGDLTFTTRNVTTDTQPTERMRITAAGQVQLGAGSVSAPTLDFGDTGTGFYKFFTNQVGVAANGIAAMCFQPTNVSPLLPVYNIDGAANAPAYAYSNDPTKGEYSSASGKISWALGGTEAFRIGGHGTSDGVGYAGLTMPNGGGGVSFQIGQETQTGIGTSGAYIIGVTNALIICSGNDATNYFRDIIAASYNASPVSVISQATIQGSPATRTYVSDATGIKLTMGTGTSYKTSCVGLDTGYR